MAIRTHRLNGLAVPLLLALAYFVTGRLGLMLPAFGSNITLIWLPTGIAVAGLYLWGLGCWPGISVAAFAVNLALGTPWPVALGIAVGNTLGPILAAVILQRCGFHPAFDRARDILVLAAAAVFGMMVTSGGGVATLTTAGFVKPLTWEEAWLIWWAGDAMGVISAAPLIFTFNRAKLTPIQLRQGEFATWLAVTVLMTWGVFVANGGASGQALALAFLPLPLVAWAALRFGPVGTSLGLIVLSVGAAYGTATARGPFFPGDPTQQVTLLWLYMATSAVLGWLISALNTARVQATGVQQLFEQALSDVSLGVLLAGLDRRITYANEGFTRLTGYMEAELLGKSCAVLQGPETDPATAARLKEAVHGDGIFDGEILNYRKDGTHFWNALLISPVRDPLGEITGFLGIQRDVSKRKRAELALNHSEEHLRTIINLEPECVKLLSAEGTLLEVNPAGLAMIEADSLDQVRGCPVEKLIVPEDREAFAAMQRRVLGGATGQCEFAIVGLKGTRRWLETHAVPYRNPQRKIIGVLGITRDVTQRREAAAERERSLATLQLFINSVPAYISYVDVEERYRLINRRYEEYFGLPAEMLLGQRLCDVQPPAAYTEMEPHVRAALSGETVRYQSHPTGPDGRSYWLDVQYVPRRSEDGTVAGFFVLVFDITETRQAEARLRDSEERLRLALSATRQGLYDLNVQTGECIVSPEYALMLGYAPEEFRETNSAWRDRLHPDDQEAVYGAYADYVAGRRSEYRVEFRQRTKNGGWKWILSLGSIVARTGDGQPLRMLGTHTDITEAKRLEQEREQYFKFFQLSNDPMCIADPFGCFLRVNPAFLQLTGYTEHELVTKPFIDFVLPEDRAKTLEEMKLQVEVRPSIQFENRYVCKDGKVILLSWMAYFDKSDVVTYATARDITRNRQAQLEREQLDRKVQETQKLESLGVLAGGIAHDFNNLLTSILGNASIAALELPPGCSAQDCIEQISEASLRAADLCKQMLAYSGRGRFVVQKIDLGQLVEQTAQMLQISISKKALLRFRLETGLPPIEVDATQIRQVIMNLVINASEAIGDHSGVISLTTGLTRVDSRYLHGTLMDPDLPEGEYVFLEVSDTGCGMSAETQARIFDPFFTTKFTGRGLGLAAVLGIVRGHKGALKVYSEVGRGTTFKLLFPTTTGGSDKSTTQPAVASEWLGEGTVLVVDDEETMRSTIARMMRRVGLEPVLVADGREAVEVFRSAPGRFALVLLDLTMPRMDGEQTFTELRRIRPDVRVVLMSGFNAHEALLRFTGKGLASFLQKPFTIEALSATLREVLAQKEPAPDSEPPSTEA